MSIKKSLLALAAMAIAAMGFASSAMAATDGVVRHVPNGTIIPAGRELHFIGRAKFSTEGGSYECHVTSVVKVEGSTGTTGSMTVFTVPDTTLCTGTGLLNGCKLKGHQGIFLPWHVTATPADFDLTDSFQIQISYTFGNCLAKSVGFNFNSITLSPLNTNFPRTVTGTFGRLGDTAAANEPIAGVELSGSGTARVENIFGGIQSEWVTASGELELTDSDRCTWFLNAS
jgi:hypothetical protein